MMKTLTFATLNINGGGANHIRQTQVNNLFKRKQVDVILLQETHITDEVEHDCCSIFKGKCVFSNMSFLSAGVGFLLKPGLAAESCLFQEVIKGRFVSLELVINNLKFIISNVYTPSEICDRKNFLFGSDKPFKIV